MALCNPLILSKSARATAVGGELETVMLGATTKPGTVLDCDSVGGSQGLTGLSNWSNDELPVDAGGKSAVSRIDPAEDEVIGRNAGIGSEEDRADVDDCVFPAAVSDTEIRRGTTDL